MSTFELTDRFERDWRGLTSEQQARFHKVVTEAFVPDLLAEGPFRGGLRVKGVTAYPGVFEMRWAPDGRATFGYGDERVPGEVHIVWRRIGTHGIFTPPPGP